MVYINIYKCIVRPAFMNLPGSLIYNKASDVSIYIINFLKTLKQNKINQSIRMLK